MPKNPAGEVNDLAGDQPGLPALLGWDPRDETPELAPGETAVWVIELDAGLAPGEDPETAEPGPELASLCPEERARAARFVRACDRRRFVRCRAALREILGRLLAEPAASLQFKAAGRGKPELDHRPGQAGPVHERLSLRFNVSHSAELALIAVCRGREVGVDVERVRPISEAGRIVASFFTVAEQAEFAALDTNAQALAFHRGWTRKEAVLKGLGVGISGLAARHETGFGMTELTTRFTPADPEPRVDEWMIWEAAPRPGFVAALAVCASQLVVPEQAYWPPGPDASLPVRCDTP